MRAYTYLYARLPLHGCHDKVALISRVDHISFNTSKATSVSRLGLMTRDLAPQVMVSNLSFISSAIYLLIHIPLMRVSVDLMP